VSEGGRDKRKSEKKMSLRQRMGGGLPPDPVAEVRTRCADSAVAAGEPAPSAIAAVEGAIASGQCVADIARALERRNKSGVYRVLASNGGIAPALRRRALVALRLEEREEISRGIAAGRSIRRIAQRLQRLPRQRG
jgi:hypothetical protein